MTTKTCEWCGQKFVPYRHWQRMCCRKCSDLWFRREQRIALETWRKQHPHRLGERQAQSARQRKIKITLPPTPWAKS